MPIFNKEFQLEMIDKLLKVFLPSAGTGAFVYAILLILLGIRLRSVAALVAFAFAWIVGNYQTEAIPWKPDARPWHWLPWAALAALLVGALSQIPKLPKYVSGGIAFLVVGAATWYLVPEEIRNEKWWVLPTFAAIGILNWLVLTGFSIRFENGFVALCLAICLLASSTVLIYAHSARFTDIAMINGAALFGLSTIFYVTKADAGWTVAGLGILLPGLLLSGYDESYSEVPWISFLLPAVAPLLMTLSIVLPLNRIRGKWDFLVPLILLLIPLVFALMMAMKAESFPYE